MEFMNFREWFLITEGQWLDSKETNFQGRPFFQIKLDPFMREEGNDVVEIDFRFELLTQTPTGRGPSFNYLNSLKGSHWIARIPEKVRLADGQEFHFEPKGAYLLISTAQQRPNIMMVNNGQPWVAAQEQLEQEVKDMIKPTHSSASEHGYEQEVQKQLASIGPATKIYKMLPNHWIDNATIGYRPTPGFSGPSENVVMRPVKYLDLFELTHKRVRPPLAAAQ